MFANYSSSDLLVTPDSFKSKYSIAHELAPESSTYLNFASSSHDSTTSNEIDPYNPSVKIGEIVGGHLELLSVLGTGTYGAVYLALDHTSGRQSAVKVLWKSGLDDEQLTLQRLEIDINQRLTISYSSSSSSSPLTSSIAHPHIINMFKFFEDDECLYLDLELHHGGDLYEAIQKVGGLDDALGKYVFDQIVEAVQYCHQKQIFHRDLKPENILVTADWQCKLCDFGLASMEPYTTELGCGSAPYMAPEARGGLQQDVKGYYCREADVWSLGVVLLNILFGCNPWKVADESDEAFCKFIRDPSILRYQFALSSECYNILRRCFDLDPLQRITLAELREAVRNMNSFVDPSLLEMDITLSSSPTDYVIKPKNMNPTTAAHSSTPATDSAFCTSNHLEPTSSLLSKSNFFFESAITKSHSKGYTHETLARDMPTPTLSNGARSEFKPPALNSPPLTPLLHKLDSHPAKPLRGFSPPRTASSTPLHLLGPSSLAPTTVAMQTVQILTRSYAPSELTASISSEPTGATLSKELTARRLDFLRPRSHTDHGTTTLSRSVSSSSSKTGLVSFLQRLRLGEQEDPSYRKSGRMIAAF